MNIPSEIKKGNRTYIYQERINNNICLYKEKEFGWKECFLIQDLIKIKNIKRGKEAKKLMINNNILKGITQEGQISFDIDVNKLGEKI